MAIQPKPHTSAPVAKPAAPKVAAPAAKPAVKMAPVKPVAKAPAKPAAKAVAPVKKAAPVKAPEKKEGDMSRNGFMTAMVLEKKYTDEEIYEMTVKKYKSCRKPAISVARWTLNQALSADKQIERLVKVDGKNIPQSKAPAKPKKTARKVVDPAKDPLKKLAGIDVHKKAQAKAKK